MTLWEMMETDHNYKLRLPFSGNFPLPPQACIVTSLLSLNTIISIQCFAYMTREVRISSFWEEKKHFTGTSLFQSSELYSAYMMQF